MKSNVEQLNPVQYRVHVEIPSEDVNKAFAQVFRKYQQKAKVQGFRPGKAPLNLVRRLYGASALPEVYDALVNQNLFKALADQTIRPIASPVVDSDKVPNENEIFKFSAVVDVLPELKFDGYKGLEAKTFDYTVKDETLSGEIRRLCRNKATSRPAEPTDVAATGMFVALSHKAVLDGKDLAQFDAKGVTAYLGDNELFEGLEKHVLGMKVGETKVADVTLPESYGDKELVGKTLTFTLTVDELKNLDVPAFDDELAKDYNAASADELKDRIKSYVLNQASNQAREMLELDLLGQILSANPFEVPPVMVDQVIDSMIEEQLGRLPDAERKKAKGDKAIRDSLLPSAKRQTQNTLILWHVVQKEGIKVEDSEVETEVAATLARYGVPADPKASGQARKSIEPRIRENLLFGKAMTFIIENAKIAREPRDI
jgi:trigger factor